MSDERKYMGPTLVWPPSHSKTLLLVEKDFSSWPWWLLVPQLVPVPVPLMIMMTSRQCSSLATRDIPPFGHSPSFIKSGPSSQQQPLGSCWPVHQSWGSLDLFYASFGQIFPAPPLPRSLWPLSWIRIWTRFRFRFRFRFLCRFRCRSRTLGLIIYISTELAIPVVSRRRIYASQGKTSCLSVCLCLSVCVCVWVNYGLCRFLFRPFFVHPPTATYLLAPISPPLQTRTQWQIYWQI